MLVRPGLWAPSLRQTFTAKLRVQDCEFTLHVDRPSSKSLGKLQLVLCCRKTMIKTEGVDPFRSQLDGVRTQNSCLDWSDRTSAATTHFMWGQWVYTLLLCDPGLTLALSLSWSPPETSGQLTGATHTHKQTHFHSLTSTHTHLSLMGLTTEETISYQSRCEFPELFIKRCPLCSEL